MTFYETLQSAGLPVLSADESGACVMGDMTPEQEALFQRIVTEHFHPERYAELLEEEANNTDFKTEFQNRLDRLTQIATVAKPSPFSQADIGNMFDALQDMARNQRAIMKRVK